MRGNGWYSQAMVVYCIANELITSDDIKYVIYSSLTIPKDYYNKFIDHIRATCPEFSKNAINTMIGTFKPKDREDRWKTLLITTSADNAFAHYLNSHGCFIDARQIGD
jgi:hypothetical protein